MTTIDQLPVFTGVIEPKPLKVCTESSVYRIPEQNLAAKVYRRRHWDDVANLVEAELWSPRTIHYALREAVVADRLYQAGVSVPQPEGVFSLRLFENEHPVPAFVMELIAGVSYRDLEYSERLSVRDKFHEETAKAARAGFKIKDSSIGHNVLYVPTEKDIKVYLHDFGGWKHENLKRWMRAEEEKFKKLKSTPGFLARIRNFWRGNE